MVCSRADNADVDPVSLVPSCKAIDDVNAVSRVEIIDSSFTVDFPDLEDILLVSKRER